MLVGGLRCAALSASMFTHPMVSTPGKTSSKLQNRIKMKKVATSGKNFFAFTFPDTLSVRFSKYSTIHSTAFCMPEGIKSRRRVPKKKIKSKTMIDIQVPISVLEIGNPNRLKITSGCICIG